MTPYHQEEILIKCKPTFEWIHNFISERVDLVYNVAQFNVIKKNRITLFLGSKPKLLPAVLSEEGLRLKLQVKLFV